MEDYIVITLTNQKGGVGKTTMSLHLAAQLHMMGYKTKLIDTDPQGTSLDWLEVRDTQGHDVLFELEAWPKDTIHKHIERKAQGFEFVIIDVPPLATKHARAAIGIADLVLVPLAASPADLWALDTTIELIEEAQIYNEHIQAAFLLNGIDPRENLSDEIYGALADYDSVPILKSVVCRRAEFKKTLKTGQVAQETSARSKATKEIKALANEIIEYFS